jgi:hypothetical protein
MALAARENDTPQIQLPAPAPAEDAILPARAEEPQSDTAVVAMRGGNRNPVVAVSLVSTGLVLEPHRDGEVFALLQLVSDTTVDLTVSCPLKL